MTDEEKLAEEYVKSVIDVNAFDWKIVREIYLAFLEGLKAGRPEWHKVADGDLPKENVKIILVRDRYKNRFINYYLLDNKMIAKMIDQFDEWIELPVEE